MIDNLNGNQLNAPAEAVLLDGRQITAAKDEDNSEANIIDKSYKTLQWNHDISFSLLNPTFPEADYARYRDFSPMQLFSSSLMKEYTS